MSTPPAQLRWPAKKKTQQQRAPLFCALVLTTIAAAGCGAPGEPVPPTPPVAAPVTDLTAYQAGDGVQLSFSLPTRAPNGDRLVSPPAVEILRGALRPDGSPDSKSLHLVDSVPGALVDKYSIGTKFQFLDPIAPAETKAYSGVPISYVVRTRLSPKRPSANSNIVTIQMFSVPQPVALIEIKVTEPAIELDWQPVARTSAGDPLANVTYNIYRADLQDAVEAAAFSPSAEPDAVARDTAQRKIDSKLHLLASQSEHTYGDKSFQFDKTYAYIVRSVSTAEVASNATANAAANLESSDSPIAIVTPRDTFPPATPQDISYTTVPGDTPDTLRVELSWSINAESDFAGYRVYRSDQADAKGTLLTPELLPTPAYRDTSVQPPHRYWYTVTAVDRAGNESAPSAATAVEIAQPSP